jgi:arylsulfatase A-like enzyme
MKAPVITAPGMHLGYVGAYGNDWIDTPALDALAAESVVFDQHIADCPDPAAPHQGWRTGRYAFPFPGDGNGSSQPGASDLFDLLRARGVITCQLTGDTSLEAALERLEEAFDEQDEIADWLIWLDLETLLPPWDVPDEFHVEEPELDEDAEEADEAPPPPIIGPSPALLDQADTKTILRLQRGYAAAMTFLDAGLAQLLDSLSERGLLDDMLLVLTTDRGQALGEHGVVGDFRPWLHEELVHVPLIVRLPGGSGAGRRVAHLTQPVDLMSTLLEAFGASADAVHGRSLWPLLQGKDEPVRAYACTGLRAHDQLEWAIRTPEWSFLLPVEGESERRSMLFRKPDDRWEVNDVSLQHLELTEQLEQTVRAFMEATRRPGPFEPPALRMMNNSDNPTGGTLS